MKPTKKNARERRFIDEYTLDGNATQAAIRAGYSPKTAHVQGCQLLKKHKNAIEVRIAEDRAKRRTSIGITKERILREVICVALQDSADFVDNHGNGIPIPELKARARRALAGFEFVEDYLGIKQKDGTTKAEPSGYTKKYKTWNKLQAIEILNKMLGFYDNAQKTKDDMTLEELVLGSFEVEDKKP